MNTSKKELREHYLQQLKQLDDAKRLLINQELQNELYQHPVWQQAKSIGITIAQSHEWQTWPIIEQAWRSNKKVAAPKCRPKDKQLDFYFIQSEADLARQFFQLIEPIQTRTTLALPHQLDLLIVPGLVFDHNHYRIGYGGGYYDRYLAQYDKVTLALSWKGQIIEHIPTERFDQPVDHLIVAQTL